jgi:hypothetical protein
MPYYKFGQNDIFNNVVETHPKTEFLIHDRQIYYNKQIPEASSYSTESSNVKHVPYGYLSFYEINIDRQESLHGGEITPTMIYPYGIKDSTLTAFKRTGTTSFATTPYGEAMTGSYPMSASLTVERYVTYAGNVDLCNHFPAASGSSRPRLTALKNTLNYYKTLSPKYDFEVNFGEDKDVNLINIPSIFYGSSIEKGSVSLKYYITGSLAGELQDVKRNGELVQVSGLQTDNNGKVAGVVLYDEGFVVLTGSWSLDDYTLERYKWCPEANVGPEQCDNPKWIYWGQLGDPDDDPAEDLSPNTSGGDPTYLFHLNSNSNEACGSSIVEATITGTTAWGTHTDFGDSLDFDGSSTKMVIQDSTVTTANQCTSSSICLDSEYTIDFWIKFKDEEREIGIFGPPFLSKSTEIFLCGQVPDQSATLPTMIHASYADIGTILFGSATSAHIFAIATNGSDAAGGYWYDLLTDPVDGNWHHFAITRDASFAVRVYWDGTILPALTFDWSTGSAVLSNTENAPVERSGTHVVNGVTYVHRETNLSGPALGGLRFGDDQQFLGNRFNGELDELRIIDGVETDFTSNVPQSPHTCPASGIDTAICKSSNAPYSSFDLSFNGTSYTPTVTMLAHAKKGELNNSTNPTFLTYGQSNDIISSTGSLYAENSELEIKNTAKSPYDGYAATFQKQTWISQIGIYDDDKNLIAVAKLATPVRKTEDRDFTFKLKLDI